jgi:hypothetical protein
VQVYGVVDRSRRTAGPGTPVTCSLAAWKKEASACVTGHERSCRWGGVSAGVPASCAGDGHLA